MQLFSERVDRAIRNHKSILVAGVDPDIDTFPQSVLTAAGKIAVNDEDFFRSAIVTFYLPSLEAIAKNVAAVKPNLAFFEQYGIGGLRAFKEIVDWCKAHDVLIIADGKRGDIGSTAAAYANAYFGTRTVAGRNVDTFHVDALTINPFLGFDTVEPFIVRAERYGTGLFLMVRNSNPGSADIQGIVDAQRNIDVSTVIARWIHEHGSRLSGDSTLSGLGAVVGATYPDELRRMREHMPRTLFLVPGYGAQGGTPADISQAQVAHGNGILVNSSRGVFGSIPSETVVNEIPKVVIRRITETNEALACVSRNS